MRSGAEAIGTLTYQLSDKACAKAGWNHAEIAKVESLFEKAIVLADRARQNLGREKAKAVLTFGPYGAALANGSEYTGDYSEPGSSHQPSFAELEHFHLHRLRQALRSSVADKIDTIAFETIPRLDEAEAILSALKVLASEMGSSQRRKPPAYISFVFPPESRGYLPWSSDSTSRKGPADIAQSICQAQSSLDWPIAGLGINCTKPTMLKLVAEELSRAVHDHGTTPDLSLFVSISLRRKLHLLSDPLRFLDIPRRRSDLGRHKSDVASTGWYSRGEVTRHIERRHTFMGSRACYDGHVGISIGRLADSVGRWMLSDGSH